MSNQDKPVLGKGVKRGLYLGGAALILVLAAEGFWAEPAVAHHAFAAEFDGNRPVQLTGRVTRLQWTNPHSWLYLDVADTDGGVFSWAVEFGAPYALMQRGLRRTDFELGAEVIVDAFLAKSGERVANASSVRFADGRDFFTAADDSPAAQ